MTLSEKAMIYATAAHAAIDQRRKYTDEPYIVHPIEVAETVESYYQIDPFITSRHNEWDLSAKIDTVVAAALCHDILEDTKIGINDLREFFPESVVSLVWELTSIAKPSDGNRAERKRIDLKKTATTSFDAKMIRLADIKSNIRTICYCDKNFARVYVPEKLAMLEIMREVKDTRLFKEVERQLILMEHALNEPEDI